MRVTLLTPPLSPPTITFVAQAGMAELADAADLKTPPTLPAQPTSLNLSISQLIERFVESRADGLSPRTNKNSRLYLRRSSAAVGLSVTGQDVQHFMASRPCSGGR